jgi:hypothetical protein
VPTCPARRACQHAVGDCSVGYRASEWLTVQKEYANALLAKKYGEEYEMDSSSEGEEADEETFIEIISRAHFPSEAVKEVNHE